MPAPARRRPLKAGRAVPAAYFGGVKAFQDPQSVNVQWPTGGTPEGLRGAVVQQLLVSALKTRLDDKKWSVRQAADLMSVPPSTLDHVLAGSRRMTSEQAGGFACFVDVWPDANIAHNRVTDAVRVLSTHVLAAGGTVGNNGVLGLMDAEQAAAADLIAGLSGVRAIPRTANYWQQVEQIADVAWPLLRDSAERLANRYGLVVTEPVIQEDPVLNLVDPGSADLRGSWTDAGPALIFDLPTDWLTRIYEPGHAILDDRFTLDILARDDTGNPSSVLALDLQPSSPLTDDNRDHVDWPYRPVRRTPGDSG